MNRRHLLFHLKEAAEELNSTVADIEADPEYSEAEFSVAMQHLYHHLNTAWNARAVDEAGLKSSTDADFNRWSAFPGDLPMMEV